jgi:riboflavin synthase
VFTGIIEELGRVVAIDDLGDSVRLVVDGPVVTSDASLGDSICVSGVCLTVTAVDGSAFSADVMAQTLKMSALGSLEVGSAVNLERAVTPATRLGGHIVQGHVDATSRIVSRTRSEHWEVVRFELPDSIARYVAARGSIAIDGTSLTISELDPVQKWFEVSLIPTTIAATTLGTKAVGEIVNLESDILARHIERLMQVDNG